MGVPTDRRYTETHEWCRVEDGGFAEVGITQFAADMLTDITFVDLPTLGEAVQAGEPFGEIESVKSAGDLYAPVSGTVLEINGDLTKDPGVINRDPYAAGWMIRLKPFDPADLKSLLDPGAYEAHTAQPH